jgi:hypothetical protein
MTLDRCFYPAGLQLRDDATATARPWSARSSPGASRPAYSTAAAWSSRSLSGERCRAPTRATLDHVAVVRVAAYAGAGVNAVRAALQPAATLLTLARLRG